MNTDNKYEIGELVKINYLQEYGIILRKSKMGDSHIWQSNLPYCYFLFLFKTMTCQSYHKNNFKLAREINEK